jgi:hypothetical protein
MSCHLSMNLMELVVALTTQLDFCHNSQKKMKTPIRFLSQLSKKLKLPREQIFANICSLGRKCSTSVTMLTSEKLISTPDREKIMFPCYYFIYLFDLVFCR